MRVSGFKVLNEFIWPAEFDIKIKDQKEEKRSGPYSTSIFCSAGVQVTSKKCDKQLTHIVRVMVSCFY